MKDSEIISSIKNIGFTGALSYKIKVLGAIDSRQSGFLSDMEIQVIEQFENKNLVSLKGVLKDQSALIGVLNALYNMRLTIVSLDIQSI